MMYYFILLFLLPDIFKSLFWLVRLLNFIDQYFNAAKLLNSNENPGSFIYQYHTIFYHRKKSYFCKKKQ